MAVKEQPPQLPHMQALLDVMAKLRDPVDGCQWDLAQSFETIAPYTIEEAYEVADAIERNNMQELREELGDLLLQVVFHAQMARDQGLFEFEDVACGIATKMVDRHPHVFGDQTFQTQEQQKAHWESRKQFEREQKSSSAVSAIDGVAKALPALTRAEKIQKRASRVGFDWTELTPVIAKLDEELLELRQAVQEADRASIEEELGDLLFSVTNVARHLSIDPELALRKSTAKFEKRFRFVETAAEKSDSELSALDADTLDRLWHESKLNQN